MQARAPPPGSYKLPSFFDDVDEKRQEWTFSGFSTPIENYQNDGTNLFKGADLSKKFIRPMYGMKP